MVLCTYSHPLASTGVPILESSDAKNCRHSNLLKKAVPLNHFRKPVSYCGRQSEEIGKAISRSCQDHNPPPLALASYRMQHGSD